MSQYAATDLAGTNRSIEHMSQRDWDSLVESRRRKFERSISEKKPRRFLGLLDRVLGENFQVYTAPSLKTVAAEIPNRDPINLLEWVAFAILVVGFIFMSIKATAAAVPYSEGVLYAMLHKEGLTREAAIASVAPELRAIFAGITALFFILLLTPSVIFFKILDHSPKTQAAKDATAIRFERWPETVIEAVSWFFQAILWMLSLNWLTPRLPFIITYVSIGWIIHINLSGGGNVFEMFVPMFVEIGLAQTVATMIEKTAAYRMLVIDAWEQRLKRWKYRRQNYMADQTFLEGLFADIREKLINITRGSSRPNAWLETAPAQAIDDAILAEFRRFTGGQKFAERVQQLDYTKALIAGEERVPPNGAATWTPTTLLADMLQRGISGDYNESKLDQDYGSKYAARKAWRGGAKDEYLKLQKK